MAGSSEWINLALMAPHKGTMEHLLGKLKQNPSELATILVAVERDFSHIRVDQARYQKDANGPTVAEYAERTLLFREGVELFLRIRLQAEFDCLDLTDYLSLFFESVAELPDEQRAKMARLHALGHMKALEEAGLVTTDDYIELRKNLNERESWQVGGEADASVLQELSQLISRAERLIRH